MYKLYKQPNGQIKQVPVNEPQEDKFPNPLEAKGQEQTVAPFVLQEQKQFDIIKENESEQARFQTKKLQNSNYQIVNFIFRPTDSMVSQDYYYNDYNLTTAIGTALEDGVMFGSDTADVTKAKYYNIVYLNARYKDTASGVSSLLENPSYIEFYAMQKLPTGNFGGKIPQQIETIDNISNVAVIESNGVENAQAFGIDIYNENAYYSQSEDLKGIRTIGLALKRINLNFASARALAGVRIEVEVGIDLNTEGNNY